jgi:dCMP deaminase
MDKAQKYMQLAKYNAELFSKDPNTKVGAIILPQDFSRILTTGINGFPRKFGDVSERWQKPQKYTWVAHAEVNAVCNAARTGIPLDNSVAVITMFPCSNCTKTLIQAGIKKIYVPSPDFSDPKWGEDFKISKTMLDEVGVDIMILHP